MEIKVYTKANEQTVIDLWSELVDGLSGIADDRIDIRQRLSTPSQLFFVAIVGNVAVGTSLAWINDGVGQLDYIAVRPGHQRKGIGTRLVRQAEKTLAEMGCQAVKIEIDAASENLMAFLARVGYQLQGMVALGKEIPGGNNSK